MTSVADEKPLLNFPNVTTLPPANNVTLNSFVLLISVQVQISQMLTSDRGRILNGFIFQNQTRLNYLLTNDRTNLSGDHVNTLRELKQRRF